MAKKEETTKVVLEREYNVPLRKEWLKVPKYKRAKKAVTALRQFIQKHMKSDNVKILRNANLKVWERGIKNPPHHIKIKASKDSEGVVSVELLSALEEKPAKKEEKKAAKEEKPKKEEKPAEKKEEPKAEKKEQPKEEKPKAEKPAKVEAKPAGKPAEKKTA